MVAKLGFILSDETGIVIGVESLKIYILNIKLYNS